MIGQTGPIDTPFDLTNYSAIGRLVAIGLVSVALLLAEATIAWPILPPAAANHRDPLVAAPPAPSGSLAVAAHDLATRRTLGPRLASP